MRSDVSSCSVLTIQAMDFPDLSDMDLEYWNGDLKLGKTWLFHSTIFLDWWLNFARKCKKLKMAGLQHEGWSSVTYSTWDWRIYYCCQMLPYMILRFVAMRVDQLACTHSWSLLEPKELDTKYSSVGYFAKRGHIVLPFRDLQTRMGCPDRRASVTKRGTCIATWFENRIEWWSSQKVLKFTSQRAKANLAWPSDSGG